MAIGRIVHLLLRLLLHLLGCWLAGVRLYIGRILGGGLGEIAALNLIRRLALVRLRRGVHRDRRFRFVSRLFVARQQSAIL